VIGVEGRADGASPWRRPALVASRKGEHSVVSETDLSQIVSVLTKIAEALNRLATIAEEQ
jgi:hypothetical protein